MSPLIISTRLTMPSRSAFQEFAHTCFLLKSMVNQTRHLELWHQAMLTMRLHLPLTHSKSTECGSRALSCVSQRDQRQEARMVLLWEAAQSNRPSTQLSAACAPSPTKHLFTRHSAGALTTRIQKRSISASERSQSWSALKTAAFPA